jgi:outer membrane protein OmpA-like peptidoglycan-associated protein
MKRVLFLVSGFFLTIAAYAQNADSTGSSSRSSKRLKINTQSLYIGQPVNPSKTPNGTNTADKKEPNPLQSIQFVQSKAEFLPSSQPALDQLVAFMRDNPKIEIELAGHTDNQGDFDKNVLLSKQRVDLVKQHLVTNGIATNRITTRGYGPTRPIASNNTEATRQLNRRVEMFVTKQ